MLLDVLEDMRAAFEKGTVLTEHGLLWATPRENGYGTCSWTTKGFSMQIRAHRVAWILENGEIPEGFDIDHNPSCPKSCVTVAHLQALSRSDHLRLGWERGELNGGWGTKRERIHPPSPEPFSWQVERFCKNCDKSFIPEVASQLHCTIDCMTEYKENRRKRVRYPRPDVSICEWCKTEFMPKHKDSKLCPRPAKCQDAAQNEKKKQAKIKARLEAE